MHTNRIIIFGCRWFDDYAFASEKIFNAICQLKDVEIVSGGAKGADALGERFAKEAGLPLSLFPADWTRHGKAAGPIRNKDMANYGTHAIGFWDGISIGTKDMKEQAELRGLRVKMFTISK